MAENILVVDDEREIADLVEVYLQNEGYTVYKFYNAGDALNCLETTPISLAVLDIMLPDMDGFALCRRIRQKFYFPIIMLTAKVEDLDKIMGLTVGADDYITKPFNPLELTARVKTQLRRYTRYNTVGFAGEQDEEIDIRGMHISKASHKCTLNGQEVAFTPLEFDIVWYLAKRQVSVADQRKVGLGHGNLGKMLLEEETKCFCFLAGHESFAAAEGAIGIRCPLATNDLDRFL